MAVKFMRTGQQGILIWDDDNGYKFGIDLFFSDMEGRQIKNPITMDDLKNVSLLFGTHDHADHIDRSAWSEIAKIHQHIKFVVPKFFEKTLPQELDIPVERFIFIDEGIEYNDGNIKIEAIPAAHEFLDTGSDGLHPYLMYIITYKNIRFCHMGDTCLYEGVYQKLREKGQYDVMFPPINGRDAKRLKDNCIGNMTYQEAADLVGCIKPKIAIPGHYDMFASNSANPEDFIDYVEVKYPDQKVKILEVCEEYSIG